MMPTAISQIPTESLKLDDQNPRLPEDLHGRPQSELLRHIYDTGALEELAQSFIDNGFFEHEPLIVLAKPEADGRRVVLEGNRRLATLMILLGLPEAEGLNFFGVELAPGVRQRLRQVPCFPIEERDDVHRFLGFRHIGGLKMWGPEAKARYLIGEVRRAAERGADDPFREVGRRVGSNARGVRTSYMALRILQWAAEQSQIKVGFIVEERFGVWLRCMNSREIREYIGVGSPTTYHEVEQALQHLDSDRLREVVGDLTPRKDGAAAAISDSRMVTDYGRVLADEAAHAMFRRHSSFSLATQVLEREAVADRLRRLKDAASLILNEVPHATVSTDDLTAAEGLSQVTRAIRDLVFARVNNADQG